MYCNLDPNAIEVAYCGSPWCKVEWFEWVSYLSHIVASQFELTNDGDVTKCRLVNFSSDVVKMAWIGPSPTYRNKKFPPGLSFFRKWQIENF